MFLFGRCGYENLPRSLAVCLFLFSCNLSVAICYMLARFSWDRLLVAPNPMHSMHVIVYKFVLHSLSEWKQEEEEEKEELRMHDTISLYYYERHTKPYTRSLAVGTSDQTNNATHIQIATAKNAIRNEIERTLTHTYTTHMHIGDSYAKFLQQQRHAKY